MPKETDVVIVGAGTVGCAIARELSRFEIRTILMEKNEDVCAQTGKANSAIVHTGFDAPVGSLEARMVTSANPMFDQIAQELNFPFQRIGALVVAINREQKKLLSEIRHKAICNNVMDVQLLSGKQAVNLEPKLTSEVCGALLVPRESIVSPYEMALAMAENAATNGVKILLSTRVTGITVQGGTITSVETSRGRIKTSWVINAAGMYCDEIASMVGECNFKITPRRGQFFIMDKKAPYNIQRAILPVPTRVTKGVLLSPTVHGNLLVGPTAEDVESKIDTGVTGSGLQQVMAGARRLVPSVSATHTIAQFAGLRPVRHPEGYVIEISPRIRNYIGIYGVRSTGITSAPAVAAYVRDLAEESGLKLIPKQDHDPIRPATKQFALMTSEERSKAIKDDPRNSNIVCRCEKVTEAEIVRAIHGPVGARSLDGIKRRTRAGMGRCQGGFCSPRVVKILARELGVPMETITKKGPGSEILLGPARGIRQ